MIQEVVELYLLKKEKEKTLHLKINEHILHQYLNNEKPQYQWNTPFKALYLYLTMTTEQRQIFKRAWDVITQKDDDKPG